MYYTGNYYGAPVDTGGLDYSQGSQPQQQQGMGMGINPMQALQGYNMFSGGAGGMGGMGGGGLSGLFGGGAGASGGAAAGGSAASGGGAGASALASNPIGWIVAAALGQNVAHNKGISSWQSALKGQSAGNIGSHFMDQWGVDEDSPIRDVAGVLGWDKSGGGIFNPNYLSKKVFGTVD